MAACMCKGRLCGREGDSQSGSPHEHQVEARERVCSDVAPYIVVDSVRLLVKQQGVCVHLC